MHSTAEILDTLQRAGARLTLSRRTVIAALCELAGHQTTHSLQQHLAAQGIHLSEPTIYRVLQWLKDRALVSQTDLGLSGATYELLSSPPHHHLVCLACGATVELPDTALIPLRAVLRADYDFEPRIEHMAFFGVCRACREARDPADEER